MNKSNRRDFLKRSALLGTAAVLPSSLLAGELVKQNEPVSGSSSNDTYTVNMGQIRATHLPPRQIIIPDVAGYKALKGDFHMHTLFSDGSVMPGDRVYEAVSNGLDIISITDHIEFRPMFGKDGACKLAGEQGDNFNIWYDMARHEAEKKEILLVRGAEITKRTMPPGHLNVLFTTDNNPVVAAVKDWKEMLRVAKDQGAFLLWNHPGWESPTGGGIEKGAPLLFTDAHEEVYKQGLLHGIELFNEWEYYPVVSDWCNEHNLAIFANSDIHGSEWNTYGAQNPLRPITLVLAKERTLDSVKEALFDRRTIGWAAGMLWGRDPWLPALFNASVSIRSITPGTLELTNNSSLPISVTLGGVIVDLPKDAKRQVYRAANVKTLTVANWMTGMNKPLEIPVNV